MEEQLKFKRSKEPQVFLSYAREDRAIAEKIAARLKNVGTKVFADLYELRTGDSLISKVQAALSSSDYVVVLLSPNSVRSDWVRYELATPLSRDITDRAVTIIPVLIADCEVPIPLRYLQYLDLRTDVERRIDELAWTLSSAPRIDFSQLNVREFEHLVTDVFRKLGFKIEATTTKQHDGGIDIVAIGPGPEPFGAGKVQHCLIQVKHYSHGRADLKSVRELVSQLAADTKHSRGVVVTSGQFTSAVQQWAADQGEHGIQLQLIDGTELKRLLLQNPDIARKHFEEAR